MSRPCAKVFARVDAEAVGPAGRSVRVDPHPLDRVSACHRDRRQDCARRPHRHRHRAAPGRGARPLQRDRARAAGAHRQEQRHPCPTRPPRGSRPDRHRPAWVAFDFSCPLPVRRGAHDARGARRGAARPCPGRRDSLDRLGTFPIELVEEPSNVAVSLPCRPQTTSRWCCAAPRSCPSWSPISRPGPRSRG